MYKHPDPKNQVTPSDDWGRNSRTEASLNRIVEHVRNGERANLITASMGKPSVYGATFTEIAQQAGKSEEQLAELLTIRSVGHGSSEGTLAGQVSELEGTTYLDVDGADGAMAARLGVELI